MTLSLSKLMASDAPLTDDERKRLLAHSALLIEVLPVIEDGIETECDTEAEHSKHARELAAKIRAALEGVEP